MARVAGTYAEVAPRIRVGDVIAFAGRGNVSEAIKYVTRANVSHVGIVLESGADQHLIAESGTFPDGFTGVGTIPLVDRVKTYEGHVWWLPLGRKVREQLDEPALVQFLRAQKGKPYDVVQALGAGLDAFDVLGAKNDEDFDAFFCSELVAGALEAGGVLPSINASEMTPIDVCQLRIYEDDYVQLKGGRRGIRGHNKKSPDRFVEEVD